ncbi:aldo/keto reductase [Niastella vici]|uniref:Aldo/keto reductase n=1 Tax=Niastella vici TaxID=1703345 RepID=A0A1V9FU61_9BACT|nr:aldo/keto reductase [Niastella vici]OQP61883.1 aldo/keto reductase [Niastella vici]
MIKRVIPSSGELIPVIGMGTWQTFDVSEKTAGEKLGAVLNAFYTGGGRLIDSSPMYGNAERIVGALTSKLDYANELFYATKVWTTGLQQGIQQMEQSFAGMQRPVIDCMQIHNLTDWRTHLPVLRKWKDAGKIRYIGITHYTDSSHGELEKIMRAEPVDFVQFNYSILERNAENRLLAVAAELGVATLINRPFDTGRLLAQLKRRPLPPWAQELEIESWGTFLLKYLIARPEVTCVIPASSNVQHVKENMKAGEGPLPDENSRARMVAYVRSL